MTDAIKHGAWDQWTADKYHQSSPKLAQWMASYLPIDTNVIDIGCGNAFYISELASVGFNCLGIEGFPLNNFLHDQIVIKDLTEPIDLPVRGSVICLEVIEHIDKKYESILLDTITKHCSKHLIVSWALTGQAGINHVNCVDHSYVVRTFMDRGFGYMFAITNDVRSNHINDNTNWFRNTLQVFERV